VVPPVKQANKVTKARSKPSIEAPAPTPKVIFRPAPVQPSVVTGVANKKPLTTSLVETAPATINTALTKRVVKSVPAPAPISRFAVPTRQSTSTTVKYERGTTNTLIAAPQRESVDATDAAPRTKVKSRPIERATVSRPVASSFATIGKVRLTGPLAGLIDAGITDPRDEPVQPVLLVQPAIADAVIVDLRLTLADLVGDALAADAKVDEAALGVESGVVTGAEELALQLGWESRETPDL
jgi:hypothetical protein